VATTHDSQVLPGIHTRLARHGLLPSEHLVDAGYTSLPHVEQSPVNTRSPSPDRCGATPPANHRQNEGFAGDDFPIHYNRQQVSAGWHGPYPNLVTHRGPADRGQVHQESVPTLPGPHPVHLHRRQCPPWAFPRENSSVICNSASARSNRRPNGRPAVQSTREWGARSTSSPTDTARGAAATEDNLPELPRPARGTSVEIPAHPRQLTWPTSRSPAEPSSDVRNCGSVSLPGASSHSACGGPPARPVSGRSLRSVPGGPGQVMAVAGEHGP